MSCKNLLSDTALYRLIKGRHGYFLCNPNDIYIGRALSKYGEFSEPESLLIKQLCPEKAVVVEIGANVGGHTIMMAKAVGPRGRVLVFEPQRVLFQNLCANIALNNLFNVEAHHMALADEQGKVTIPDLDYSKESNYGAISANQFNVGRPVTVDTLDAIFDLPQLYMIKIDVEGMELQVLKGAMQTITQHKPILYVENDRRKKHSELVNFIDAAGYNMFWHTPRLFNGDNFAQEKENIYKTIVSVNLLCVHRSRKQKIKGLHPVDIKQPHIFERKVR